MKRHLLNWFPICILNAVLLAPVTARSEVVWRVSFKVIQDASGDRPNNIANSDLQAQIDFANTNPYFLSRGFRLQSDEIIDLSGVSQWFDGPDETWKTFRSDLQAAAEADPSLYQWRTDAINVYVNDDNGGGMTGDIIQLGGTKIMNTPWTVLHEIGHFMSLAHTFDGESGCTEDCTGCTETQIPGNDDDIDDTLPDHECWKNWDDIASNAFPTEFASGTMTATQLNEVDNVWFNIMSYHSNRDRFTSDQLDAMADTAAGSRSYVTDHRTWFVDTVTTPPETGLSSHPFDSIQEAVDKAGGGDVLIIRTGTYDEPPPITKAVTLRASRGNAIIGR